MSQEEKIIGVTQKAIVIRGDGKFLAILRSKTAPSYPEAWDLPGGELDYGEDPMGGIIREIKEETGLDVKNLKPFDTYGRENPVGFWVTIAYSCEAVTDEVTLSYEHSEFKWVNREEFLLLTSIPKISRFVSNYSAVNIISTISA